MAIKIMDKFEPAGNFKIASATDIEYGRASVATELEDIRALLTEVPTLKYTHSDVESEYTHREYAYREGSKQTLNFYIRSTLSGNCNVTILRKKNQDEEEYSKFKQLSVPKGNVSIDLGAIGGSDDYYYRIQATDSRSTQCTTPYYTGSGESKVFTDYIEFRVYCSSVMFTSSYDEEFRSKIYSVGNDNIIYPVTVNFSQTASRTIYYKISSDVIDTSTVTLSDITGGSWGAIQLNGGSDITGGTSTSASLTIPNNFVSPGKWNLYTVTVVSVGGTKSMSEFMHHELDSLSPNSITTSIVNKESLLSLKEDSFLLLEILPKTNIRGLDTATGGITILCKAYYKNGAGDDSWVEIENKSDELQGTHNYVSEWDFGRISIPSGAYKENSGDFEGKYQIKFEVSCIATYDGREYTGATTVEISAAEEATLGQNYERDKLIFQFRASDMDSSERDRWYHDDALVHTDSSNNNFRFYVKLNNITEGNGVTNDVQYVAGETDGRETVPVLLLNNGAYGVLFKETYTTDGEGNETVIDTSMYTPYSVLEDTTCKGFTFEAYVKSRCIGELRSKAISHRLYDSENQDVVYPGFDIGYDNASISKTGVSSDAPLSENVWQHIVVVLDWDIKSVDDISDGNKHKYMFPMLRTYIDGTLCKVTPFTLPAGNTAEIITGEFKEPSNRLSPFVLNGLSKKSIESIDGVIDNIEISDSGECYISLMRFYNKPLTNEQVESNYINALTNNSREYLSNRETTQTKVYFVRNSTVQSPSAYGATSGLTNTTFATLNTLSSKDDSKTHCVNCTMFVTDGDAWVKYSNVDVFLQGTSSLTYPVKNYKIKIYDDAESVTTKSDGSIQRTKRKITPPFQTEWHTEDNVYTLKCDYMEQSHRNNTPTASYYSDEVLDAVIRAVNGGILDESKYSPARRIVKTDGTGEDITSYRPYRDAIGGFPCIVYYNDAASYDVREAESYEESSNDIQAGSFMFNTDKEGLQLGFEIEPDELGAFMTDSESNILSDFTDKRYLKKDSQPLTGADLDYLPCVSYEGGTNDEASAATFTPFGDAYNERITNWYNTEKAKRDNGQSYQTVIDSYDTVEEFITAIYDGVEGDVVEKVDSATNEPVKFVSKYGYYKATMDPRYTYADEFEDDVDKLTYNKMTYEYLDRAITWLASCQDDETKFTDDFEKYFSLEYCIAYYLQMMVFTQVDNAGKNAMFDCWGDGKIYPRPYDMDTQMGLDNSGSDIKKTYSEINFELGRESLKVNQLTADLTDWAPCWESNGGSSHHRFDAYTTSQSNLWTTFGKFFFKKIQDVYRSLRTSGVYSVNRICDAVDAMTTNVIPNTVYNADAESKYMRLLTTEEDEETGEPKIVPDTRYTTCVNGNRANRYREFLSKRLVFLDSYFEYFGGTFSVIDMRTNYKIDRAPLGISVHTPQYVKIDVGSEKDMLMKIFVSPEDTYEYVDPDTRVTYKGNGALVFVPLKGNNKEIKVYGAGEISAIRYTEKWNLNQLLLGNATKMTEIDISNSKELASLSLGSNKFLRKLIVNGTTKLKIELDVSNCSNIKELSASSSGITGLKLPPQSELSTLNLNGAGISTLKLANTKFLSNVSPSGTGLILTGCTGLSTLELSDCDGLVSNESTKLDLSVFKNLSSVKISGCKSITHLYLNSLGKLSTIVLNSNNIKYATFNSSSGSAFSNLSLINLPNLQHLYLNRTGPKTGRGAVILGNSVTLSTLDMSYAKIDRIATSYGVTDEYNFTGVSFANNGTVKFEYNERVTTVKNLTFVGNLSRMFSNCINLTSTSDNTLTSGASANRMFADCTSLTTIDISRWDMTDCRTADSMFYGSPNVSRATINAAMNKLTSCTSMNHFLYTNKCLGDAIPSTFFKNFNNLTDISGFFRSTNVVKVEQGLLDGCGTLTDVSELFASCSKLEFVPCDIFMNCKSIENADGAFSGCENLGKTTSYSDVECIFSGNSTKVFNDDNSVTSIKLMFKGCKTLGTLIDGKIFDGLHGFFSNLTNVTDASAAFFGCSTLPSINETTEETPTKDKNILANCANLKKLDLTFYGCTNAKVTMPLNLFGVRTNNNVESMRGMFGGCKNLTGTLTNSFFSKTPNVTKIGAVHKGTVKDDNDNGIGYYPGIFANTGLTKVSINALSGLKYLQDSTAMFFNGTVKDYDGGYEPGSSGGTLVGFVGVDNETLIQDIGNMFHVEAPIENTSLMFAGQHNLQGLVKSIGNTSITTAVGMFCGCSSLSGCDSDIFKNREKLSNIGSIFADCSKMTFILKGDIFNGCTRLSNCSASFMGSGVSVESGQSIPSNMFNSCRNTITDVSRMFASCKNLKCDIGTGYAVVNSPSTSEQRYTEYKQALLDGIKSEAEDVYTNITDIGTTYEKLDSILEFFRNYTLDKILFNEQTVTESISAHDVLDDGVTRTVPQYDEITESQKYAITSWEFLDNSSNPVSGGTGRSDGSYTPPPSATQVKYKYISDRDTTADTGNRSLIDIVGELSEISDIEFIIESEYNPKSIIKTKELYVKSNKWVDEYEPGLLSNCAALEKVDYMFGNCQNLFGPIPCDMFYGNTNLVQLSSIEGIFANCYRLTMKHPNSNGSAGISCLGNRYPCVRKPDGDLEYYDRTRNGGCFYEVHPTVYNTDNTVGNITVMKDDGQFYSPSLAMDYFLPNDWMKCLTSLSKIDYAFYNVGLLKDATDSNKPVLSATSNPFTLSQLKLPSNLFSGKYGISSAKYAFAWCASIGGAKIGKDFLKDSLGVLSDISGIFMCSELTSIGEDNTDYFLMNAVSSNPLSNISKAFLMTNVMPFSTNTGANTTNGGLSGVVPDFTDDDMFGQMSGDNIKGAFHKQEVPPYNSDGANYATLYKDYVDINDYDYTKDIALPESAFSWSSMVKTLSVYQSN